MKTSFLVRVGMAGVLWCGAMALGRAASSDGYRVVFPEQPLPIGSSNAWASSNLTSVAITAGGSGAWSNRPNSEPVFPVDVPPNADPNFRPVYRLEHSAFGQMVTGSRPDIYLGQPINPPLAELPPGWSIYWAGMTNVQVNPANHAFYEPSVQQLYAIAGGALTVSWVITDGQSVSNLNHTYLVSSAPATRPYRVYWTEEPYNAPTIDLSGRFVRFLWNEEIPAPVTIETNIGGVIQKVVVRGLWVDSGQLHVQPGPTGTRRLEGLVVMQYFKTGALNEQVPGGVIVVQVSEPQVNILDAQVGSRLLPRDGPFGHEGLTARITQGLQTPAAVYQHQGQYSHSPKNGWVFPIRRTDRSPWEIEIYWQEADHMGTLWPYEVDWYSADWTARPQIFVRGEAGRLGASVPIPSELAPALEDFQEPPGHALLPPDGVFHTTGEGYALLRFQSADNLWFQTVRSVSHTNTYFDREPRPWTIGVEIGPNVSSDALLFNGVSDTVTVSNLPSLGTNFTVETWFLVDHPDDGYLKPVLARPGSGGLGVPESIHFLLAVNGEGRLIAQMGKGNTSGGTPYGLSLASPPVRAAQWYHVAFTVETNRQVTLYLNAQPVAAGTFTGGTVQTNTEPLYIGWAGPGPLFRGQLDDIRLWTTNRSFRQIVSGQINFLHDYATVDGLLAYFPVEANDESTLRDLRQGIVATVVGCRHVEPGATGLLERYGFSGYHGYIYDTNGLAPYNAGRYAYPTNQQDALAETHIFGVNSGVMEIWWSHKVQQEGMPVPVYFPAWAQVYTNIWPAKAPLIVLASGQGSPAFRSATIPTIYVQNNAARPGYNPNEEHALIGQANNGYVAFALRDDLNAAGESEPFVLVDRTDPVSGRPAMEIFKVVRTSAEYPSFTYQAEAGEALLGPHPLDLLPMVELTSSTSAQAWRDRKWVWYAVGAGPTDAETADVIMKCYYPVQEGFWFPHRAADEQPAFGTPVSWLPVEGVDFNQPDYWTNGTPTNVTWVVSWPTAVPLMKVGQTLTKAVGGLPEIWGQLSVDVVYEQSVHVGASNPSVTLIDPTIERAVTLPHPLAAYGFTMGSAGSIYNRWGLVYFNGLPPDLSGRLYYDPNSSDKNLRFVGQLVEPRTSPSFLLLNRLTRAQRAEIKAICSTSDPILKAEWDAAIDRLAVDVVEVEPNQPFDHLALAAVGTGTGYVTLAFNNAANPDMGVSPGDPITVLCIKVIPELYTGFLIPMTDQFNLLSDQMNMLYSESLGGEADNFEFQWRAQSPTLTGGVPDNPDAAPLFAQQDGLTRLRIGGQGATLLDMVNRFFTVRYRATNDAVVAVVGSGWSEYTAFSLAEGWVERVLNELTPFNQRMRDLYNNPAETQASMLAQAGPPYVGDVALNMESVSSAGLIEVYQTVLNRARHLSLDLGIKNPGVNQQLMLAVSRLHALYMLLGNEAYADALDPTIGFGSQTVLPSGAVLPLDYGAFASSLFCFENQVPTLLDEELALMRGRGDPTLAPGMKQWPYYNRLVWNFTRGIDAGEVAYAVNYNIRDSASVLINEETAAQLYPQGHGDAWGHYLSALKGYYHLLRNPYFNWGDPSITPLLLGYQVVSADYKDEERFAEATAALARTGTEIVRRAYRKSYTESPSLSLVGVSDEDTNRLWSASDWAARAGQAAFFNWAVCQSLLPAAGTNVAIDADITRLDRATVKAVNVIPACYVALQREADHVEQGVNPLGLVSDAVPFDINPAQVDAGQTHFEQIFERAAAALRNAQAAFDTAQEAARLLRQQSAGQIEFQLVVQDEETAYKNQLIQLLGYPYADDIGVGRTYPQGYDGPDYYHFLYMDLEALGFDKRADIDPITVTNFSVTATNLQPGKKGGEEAASGLPWVATNLTLHFAQNGFLIKPPNWTGRRRAEGQVQQAYGEYLVALLEFRAACRRYNDRYVGLVEEYEWYHEDKGWADLNDNKVASASAEAGIGIPAAWTEAAFESLKAITEHNADFANETKLAIMSGLPTVIGLANDVSGAARMALKASGVIAKYILMNVVTTKEAYLQALKASAKTAKLSREVADANTEAMIADQERRMAILGLDRELDISEAELQAAFQRLQNAQEKFLSVQAEAERVLVDLEWSRSQTTARIASMRYNDMAFRIFRSDALRRYSDTFELAARYTYLAAKAYDYETGLLKSETRYDPGTVFFNDIIRARTIGRLVNGQPALAATGIGEPGLSDILARMNANWSVLKGRFGFNNPQSEIGRFSLRTELFRILPGAQGDEAWRQKLEQCKVDNLLTDGIFRRYCLPFASQQELQAREPALVIPFHSTIDFARNFFDWELAGGDNAYDSTHFATKIRSVGVWFSDYDRLTSASDGLFLANQPRVYLVPAGLDVMRSPSDLGESLRGWKVLDQAIPVPFPITAQEMTRPDFIPMYDSLNEPWAQARRYPALRAFHDNGFSAAEMAYNSRLVGRSVWNTQWVLIIPGGTLNNLRDAALNRFIYGPTGTNGVSDIKLHFQTYSYSGN